MQTAPSWEFLCIVPLYNVWSILPGQTMNKTPTKQNQNMKNCPNYLASVLKLRPKLMIGCKNQKKNSQIVDWLNSMRLGDGGFISTGEYIQPKFAQTSSTNILKKTPFSKLNIHPQPTTPL